MDTIPPLQSEVLLDIVEEEDSGQIPAHPLQILDELSLYFDSMVTIQAKLHMFHVVNDDISIFWHTAGKYADLEHGRHFL